MRKRGTGKIVSGILTHGAAIGRVSRSLARDLPLQAGSELRVGGAGSSRDDVAAALVRAGEDDTAIALIGSASSGQVTAARPLFLANGTRYEIGSMNEVGARMDESVIGIVQRNSLYEPENGLIAARSQRRGGHQPISTPILPPAGLVRY